MIDLSSKIADLNEGVPYLVSEEDFHETVPRFRQLKLLKEIALEVPCISLRYELLVLIQYYHRLKIKYQDSSQPL